jgi:long-chain-fatty-acid--CoA ligase ACSBG
MGYLYNEKATRETIDANGFLHSGDIGKVDEQGLLKITGRLKELIITAGGENIPPVLIECLLKEQLPIVSNVVVVGDQKKFLVSLFTFFVELNEDGSPSDKLTPIVTEAFKALGSKATTSTEASKCPVVQKYVQKAVDFYNEKKSISRAQYIRKWAILPKDLSIAGGELTPTTKLKRKEILTKYSDIIESLYQGDEEQQQITSKL